MSGPAHTQPSKEAVVVVLDVGPSMAASPAFPQARGVCQSVIEQKLFLCHSDEVGLVLSGTGATLNRLNAKETTMFRNISVVRPIEHPTAEFLRSVPIDPSAVTIPPEDRKSEESASSGNMFDALVVAADLLEERTAGLKFHRRIVLISDVKAHVRRKEDLPKIVAALQSLSISLAVIAVDFAEDERPDEEDWGKLSPQIQNQRVLEFICNSLDDKSGVLPIEDASAALSTLRKKNEQQRTLHKAYLCLHDVKINVNVYTKSIPERFPSFDRVGPKGEELSSERKYFSIADPDTPLDAAADVVKAYKYGSSVVPLNEVDEAAMKFKAERGLFMLGFVPQGQVPLHLLHGGCKAIAAAPGDANAAKAFAALVHGMDQLNRAMLVRYVYRDNTDPKIGVCFPRAKVGKASFLYFVQLPFSEDIRQLSFSRMSNVNVAPSEAKMVEDMVTAMTVPEMPTTATATATATASSSAASSSVFSASSPPPSTPLPPNVAAAAAAFTDTRNIFNPQIQQYYGAMRKRLRTSWAAAVAAPAGAKDDDGAVAVDDVVRQKCWATNDADNFFQIFLAHSSAQRKAVADTFPAPPLPTDSQLQQQQQQQGDGTQKRYWFTSTATAASATARPNDDDDDEQRASKKHRVVGTFDEAASAVTSITQLTATTTPGTNVSSSSGNDNTKNKDAGTAVAAVSTVDPITSFRQLLKLQQGKHVELAMYQLQHVVLSILQESIGAQYYARCLECIVELRRACVEEGEAVSFNKFLLNLMHTLKDEAHSGFWTDMVVGKGGVKPITKAECPESNLEDDAAGAEMLKERVVSGAQAEEDAPEEDIFDQLE